MFRRYVVTNFSRLKVKTIMSTSVEQELLNDVSREIPWSVVQELAKFVRESGSEAEWQAANYLVDELRKCGVQVKVYEPELYLSAPRRAALSVISTDSVNQIRAKPPAFSQSTNGTPVVGEVVYLPAQNVAKLEDIFDSKDSADELPVRGKIVLTEGLSMPMKVTQYERRGAIAQIYINPGRAIHEGICTPIWGTPTLENVSEKPSTPVICVNKPDGEYLIDLCRKGLKVKIETELQEGWRKCPLPVAFVEGSEEPEKFLLVHGHLDSWHEGVGDNATGDAALFELARLFTKHRGKLRRSLRVAWWPGHSYGRYGGSTWFADQFAEDLDRNCIAQVDIDSPGCRWATEYREDVMWMREADTFCREVIRSVTGQESRGKRPLRAGDYSFNQIGLTGFFMLLSNIPPHVRQEKGFHYVVGGCGGNTAWHTEDDLLDVADPEVLYTDTKIYASAIYRVLNSDIYPFDHTAAVEEIVESLETYQEQCGEHFDLNPALSAARELKQLLHDFYVRCQRKEESRSIQKELNQCILELARILIPINYAKGERFQHDPAISLPPLPKLEPAVSLPKMVKETNRYRFLQTQLLRKQNEIVAALRSAHRLVRNVL